MNTTTAMDEIQQGDLNNPGLLLAQARENRGYTQEYVAGKLNLRVRIIELIEANDYHHMPEPVFIKGYLRAYAKFLNIPAEPLLELFNAMYHSEKKTEKLILWQTKKESRKGERWIRWLTGLFAVGALIVLGIWWQKNKEMHHLREEKPSSASLAMHTHEAEIKLTDLSKMQAMFVPVKSNNEVTPMEKQRD